MKDFFERHLNALGILLGSMFLVMMSFIGSRIMGEGRSCLNFTGVIELHVDGVEEGLRSCDQVSLIYNEKKAEKLLQYTETINQLSRIQFLFPKTHDNNDTLLLHLEFLLCSKDISSFI